MRVLAISHSCAADVNQQWYVALSEIPEIEIQLIIPSNWRDDCTGHRLPPKLLPSIRFPVHFLPVLFPGRISTHVYPRGMAKLIDRFKPDVVFVDEEPWSFAVGQTAFLCRARDTPFVCYTKQNLAKRYPPPFSIIEKLTYRHARAIIALTEEVRDVLRTKGFGGASPVIPHACDTTLFKPGGNDALRAQLGLRANVVGYLGRLVPEKGVRDLLQAFINLEIGVRQRCSLLLAGAGPEEKALRAMAEVAGIAEQVIFAGPVPHLMAADYIRCMDVFVLPSRTTKSWKEQFGRVIIEAKACNVVTIGSNSGNIPSLIEQTGGGFVFPEGDIGTLTRQLANVFEEPRPITNMKERGRRAVEERFTYKAIAEELAAALKSSAGRPSVPAVRKHHSPALAKQGDTK